MSSIDESSWRSMSAYIHMYNIGVCLGICEYVYIEIYISTFGYVYMYTYRIRMAYIWLIHGPYMTNR